MLKMVIVDDEPDMLRGILNFIPFDNLDITVCAVCENGLDGLKNVTCHRPDIILCDISMPKMTGFEMLEKVGKIPDYNPQVIMLTGHDDFVHAREAIKHRVMDYLVKPVMPGDVLSSIIRAKEQCEKNRLAASQSCIGIESMRVAFIETLFSENALTDDEIKSRQKELGITLSSSKYLCAYFFIRDYGNLSKSASTEEISALKSIVISAFGDIFPGCFHTSFGKESVRFLLPYDGTASQGEIIRSCRYILTLSSLLSDSFICISRPCGSFGEINQLAKQTEYCAKFAFCFSEGRVLCYDIISNYMKNSFEHGAFSVLESTSKGMKIKNISEWHSNIDEFKEILDGFEYYDPSYAKTYIYQAMSGIIANLLPHQSGSLNPVKSNEVNSLWDNIQNSVSQNELIEICIKVADEFEYIADASVSRRSLLISEQMKHYVEEHYSEQISVVAISKDFYLSPNYMRKLFMNVNGVSFKNYLKDYRMKKAKEMLTTGKYKIYEVAINVGYNDVKSFRSAFFEHFGTKPSSVPDDEIDYETD